MSRIPERNITQPFGYAVRFNVDVGWRQRFGGWLRNIAARIDGRLTMAWEIDTYPEISDKDKKECLVASVTLVNQNVERLTMDAARENIIKAMRPELYKEDHGRDE